MSTDELDSMLRGVASAPAVRPPPKLGDRLGGRYVIEAFLGEGGMGAVYRALDEKLGEQVALKIVRGDADDTLRDEVRLAQKVTHVNVCRTFDLEEIDGQPLVKMEYVAGETLAARLARDKRLPIEEAVRIARAIAAGLAAAHAQRIVHGDLKPGNVMLAGERVVLMDFGVARLVVSPLEGIRGTPGYIAPELVRDRKVDERADQYALGCLVYEMLAGEPVFGRGAPVAIAMRHVTDAVPDVRAKRAETPRWLARAVAQLLAKHQEDRPAGLIRLVAGPRSSLRVIAPIVLVLIATAGFIGWRLYGRPRWVAQVHDFQVYQDENMDLMSFSPDGQWLVYASDREARELWRPYVMSRVTGEISKLPIPPGRNAFAPRFTWDGTAILYALVENTHSARIVRQPIVGSPPHAVGAPQDLVSGWSPDDCGDAIVYVTHPLGGWRVMMRLASGETRQLYASTGAVSDPRCDTSGQHVAFVDLALKDVFLVDRLGNVLRATADHGSFFATFARGGRSFVVARDDAQLYELPVAGGTPRRLIVDDGPDGSPDVSRDDRFIAFTRDNTKHYPEIDSGSGSRFLTRQSDDYLRPRFVTPDLIVAMVITGETEGPRIVTVRVGDGTITALARGFAPFPSLDGGTIYFGDPKLVGGLGSVPVSGGTPNRVDTLPGRLISGNAGPDGEHVLVSIGDSYAGYRVRTDGVVEAEGVRGLVSVAPTGGWRAVTLIGETVDAPLELVLVPPAAALDAPTRRFPVVSLDNRWFDDHHISYCLDDRCEILDISTNAITRISAMASRASTITPDGDGVLDNHRLGSVTRHLITNFGER